MGLQRALEFVGGAVGVYLAMVACADAPRTGGRERPEGSAGESVASAGESGRGSGADGAPGSSAGGQGGLLVGAGGESVNGGAGLFTDPTPDAGAQEAGAGPGPGTCECPEPPVVPEEITWERYEVPCDTALGSSSVRYYAFLELDGVSPERRVRAIVTTDAMDEQASGLGITGQAFPLMLTEAGVGVFCGLQSAKTANFYVPSR